MQYSAFVKVVYDAWQISKWITEWSIYRNDQNSFSENFSNLTIFDHKICPKSFENVKIINPLHNTVREYFLGGVGGGTIIKLYSFFLLFILIRSMYGGVSHITLNCISIPTCIWITDMDSLSPYLSYYQLYLS